MPEDNRGIAHPARLTNRDEGVNMTGRSVGRSDAFRRLRRAIRLAFYSDRAGMPPHEAIEQALESRRRFLTTEDLTTQGVSIEGRRRFLGSAAVGLATAALAPLATSVPRAWAAPRTSGTV